MKGFSVESANKKGRHKLPKEPKDFRPLDVSKRAFSHLAQGQKK